MKYYNLNSNSKNTTGLYLSGRVYTTTGGVAGKTIAVTISYVYGGVPFDFVVNLGPTDANGFAKACPAGIYPDSVLPTVGANPVNNAPGAPSAALSNVPVQYQNQNAVPAFCP